MAEVRIPFCATAELQPPFILNETYADPNGVKSVLFDISNLNIAGKEETVDVANIGQVQLCIFYVIGTIPYICNVFPIVQTDATSGVREQMAIFDGQAGNTAADCVATTSGTPLGWLSATGCVSVEAPIGGSSSFDNIPVIESVTVDDLAVASNLSSTLIPTCPDSAAPCGEEGKKVVKWRGCFVITTASA
ncbi:MAG: hypothetical protein ACOX8Q_01295 [Christensenellales bacterium]|jgi:hypothetical protein